jgi:hypothetical protein
LEFKYDIGVYVCPHIFEGVAPILFSVRDFDGSYQFLCGDKNCVESSKPHFVHIGFIANTDPTINELTSLKPGMFAERFSSIADWEFGQLDHQIDIGT